MFLVLIHDRYLLCPIVTQIELALIVLTTHKKRGCLLLPVPLFETYHSLAKRTVRETPTQECIVIP